MRNIKFRVWDKIRKRFLNNYSTAHAITNKGRLLISASDYYSGFQNVNIEDFVVQQSTELVDKNGKTIFEGDIIIFMGKWDEKGNVIAPDYEHFEVGWSMGGFHAFPLDIVKRASSSCRHWKGVGHTNNEVIGNVLENPELLTKDHVTG